MLTQFLTDIIPSILAAIGNYIEPAVVALIILGGIIAKRLRPKDSKIGMAWATFVIAAIITVAWAFVQNSAGDLTVKDVPKYLFSYILATALYDWLIKYLIAFFNDRFKKLTQKLKMDDEQ